MVVVVAQSAPPTDKIANNCLLKFLNLARDKTMQASIGGAIARCSSVARPPPTDTSPLFAWNLAQSQAQ